MAVMLRHRVSPSASPMKGFCDRVMRASSVTDGRSATGAHIRHQPASDVTPIVVAEINWLSLLEQVTVTDRALAQSG
jgi:hypothetical protein